MIEVKNWSYVQYLLQVGWTAAFHIAEVITVPVLYFVTIPSLDFKEKILQGTSN